MRMGRHGGMLCDYLGFDKAIWITVTMSNRYNKGSGRLSASVNEISNLRTN